MVDKMLTARVPTITRMGGGGWPLGRITQLKAFAGNIVLVGCGSFGQAVLPLLVRDLGLQPARLTVVTADQRGRAVADGLGVRFVLAALGPANLRR